MAFDLVDGRDDAGKFKEGGKVRLLEVADADRFCTPGFADFFECAPRLRVAARHRPVNQVKINVVETETVEAAVEGTFDITDPLRGIPYLCGNKKVFPRNPACADPAADAVLIFIGGGGIDQTVAVFCRGDNCFFCLFFCRFVSAKPQKRHRSAVVWDEFIALCEQIQSEGIQPLYFGFKDTWTCLAPWNAVAVDLAPADVCAQVNRGKTTFSKEYKEVAERMLELLPYGPDDPFAYDYNGACTAFAKGESAMYTIGSYAIPQIQTVNPDMEIDSFVMPASNNKEENKLNSGIDLQFCVMQDCKNKEAAYEVLDFLLEDENVQAYLDAQKAVPCKEGDFELPSTLEGMKEYIKEGKMSDYQDHYYPSEMAVDAQIQTFLMKKDSKAFLKKFDTDWVRYNRDIIRKVEDYEKSHND